MTKNGRCDSSYNLFWKDDLDNFGHLVECIWVVLQSVVQSGFQPEVVLELPSSNDYWLLPQILQIEKAFSCKRYETVGCEYGLRAQFGDRKGQLTKKPWTLSCSSSVIGKAMARKCSHKYEDHCPVSGLNMLISESYPTEFAEQFHEAFKELCENTVNPSEIVSWNFIAP